MASQLPVEFKIILGLTTLVTLFVIVMSIGLIVHKAIQTQRSWRSSRLFKEYSAALAEILLREMPPLPPGSKTSARFRQFESLIVTFKSRLEAMSESRRKLHRAALRDVLVEFAQDLEGETSERLVYVFSSFGFVDDQLRLLQSKKWWIRAQAARALGLVRARKGITQLTFALEDPHPDVRAQAMQSLIVLVGVDALGTIFRIGRNLSRWNEIELSAIVMEFKEKAVPHLIEALNSEDDSIVLFATEMLAEIGFVVAVEPILKIAANHPRSKVRAKALEALGRLGDGRAEPLLLEMSTAGDDQVRLNAIEAVGELGSQKGVAVLLSRFPRSEIPEKLLVARALGKCGPEGVGALKRFENDPDPLVRGIAAEVMEEIQESTGSTQS